MDKVLVTGANRGIGLEFVKYYSGEGHQVFATTRSPGADDELHQLASQNENIRIVQLELEDDASIAELKKTLDDRPIDLLILNAGYYGPRIEGKHFGSVNYEEWAKLFNVNVLGNMKVVEALSDNVAASMQKKIAVLSAIKGSIGDNTGGGTYPYRSAKAALNAVTKSLAIDLLPQGIKVVALHPGWVKTDMGGFKHAPLETAESVQGMVVVISEMTEETTGRFIAYDKRDLPW